MAGSSLIILGLCILTTVLVGVLLFAWRGASRSGRRMEDRVRLLQENESRLIQTEKMATVGQVAAGVAHEINNPVGFIMSNLFTLREYFDYQSRLNETLLKWMRSEDQDPGELRRQIEDMLGEDDPAFIHEDGLNLINESLDGATRVKEIVLNLMAMAKVEGDGEVEIDLNEGIRAVGAVLQARPGNKEGLKMVLGELPPVLGRPNELNQALLHLLENALEHTPAGTPVTIISDADERQVLVRISDEGPGIPRENQELIFNPFFTTKSAGKGAGLGLSLARDIISRHQGNLCLVDCPHPGACFRITLPTAAARHSNEKPAPLQEEPVFKVRA